MKSIILNLKERVLVVETPEGTVRTEIMNNGNNTQTILLHLYDERGCFQSLPISEPGILEEICKGSELSEEILGNLIPKEMYSHLKDKDAVWFYAYFISAIEANGYYWSENAEGIEQACSEAGDYARWSKAESKTFHPEQCLLFKII